MDARRGGAFGPGFMGLLLRLKSNLLNVRFELGLGPNSSKYRPIDYFYLDVKLSTSSYGCRAPEPTSRSIAL